jgi:hypothetical protein
MLLLSVCGAKLANRVPSIVAAKVTEFHDPYPTGYAACIKRNARPPGTNGEAA